MKCKIQGSVPFGILKYIPYWNHLSIKRAPAMEVAQSGMLEVRSNAESAHTGSSSSGEGAPQ
jgi:hypothetical protein